MEKAWSGRWSKGEETMEIKIETISINMEKRWTGERKNGMIVLVQMEKDGEEDGEKRRKNQQKMERKMGQR